MGTSTGPFTKASSQYPGYYPSAAYSSYAYYSARIPAGGDTGYQEDRRRLNHIFPHKQSHQKSFTRQAEQPIDWRCVHIEQKNIPVQIVDADKIREEEERAREARAREEMAREENRRASRSRDNPSMRETWESTEYSSKVEYKQGSKHNRDKHVYDHRRTTRVYQADPMHHATHSSYLGMDRYLCMEEEYVSRRKEYEVHRFAKGPSESREQVSRSAKPGYKEHKFGKGILRARD